MEELRKLLNRQHMEQIQRMQYISFRLRWSPFLPSWLMRGRR